MPISEAEMNELINDNLIFPQKVMSAKDTTVPISLEFLESLQKRLQKAEEINDKMLTVILEQSEHIRYLEALNRVKRL